MSYNRILIEDKLRKFLVEDNNFIDVSSKSIPFKSQTSAKIYAKSNGYVSGLEEMQILFDILKVQVNLKKSDGNQVFNGEVLAELRGSTRAILLGERLALNLMTHMSAITTSTRKFGDIIRESGKPIKIACTRKTLPGLRIFAKKAVELGKGDTHRFSLDDMVLLKDTHLRFYKGDLASLITETRKYTSFTKKIEVEVENINDVVIAAENGADIIMLDNMSPELVKEAIDILKQKDLRSKVLIEVSGNITLDNIVSYLPYEPDVISTSIITQKPFEYVDFSLKFD
ncbi:MAG: carboxylating nicotinate-nucleotide diphosphorylase [Candidatus Lokiarchaeota archaeon]|nr:carboxylating nicotinate-nucleotide diphosphorylase [Candidatus Lokiarchaeota archaeon]